MTLDIAASSTLTWRIPHQIPSTGELDIELSQKLSAIALSDVQAERVAAQPISDASSAIRKELCLARHHPLGLIGISSFPEAGLWP